MRIANFKAMTYSWRTRMDEIKNFFRMFPGTLSIIHVLGVWTSGSVPSRSTERVSNIASGFWPQALFQRDINPAERASEPFHCGVKGRGKLRTRAGGCQEEEVLTECVISFQAFGSVQVIWRVWAFEGV